MKSLKGIKILYLGQPGEIKSSNKNGTYNVRYIANDGKKTTADFVHKDTIKIVK